MKILKIYPTSVNDRFIAEAVEALRDGQVVVYPTDSLYALGCSALDKKAIERLARVKDIASKKESLSIICSGISEASEYARIDNAAFRMLKQYLPGAVTFLLPAALTLPKIFRERRTVGIRIPASPVALALAEALGNPLLTTSVPLPAEEASDPDAVSLTFAATVPLMIDGGHTPGVPTTVVDLSDSSSPSIVREGAADVEL
ncbi:MAG: L-threonylcarbamoyladenylate synthase [Clostridium sp.]|nr:L-threonylcarbamoyladenylate synthase [Clostridium sp.]